MSIAIRRAAAVVAMVASVASGCLAACASFSSSGDVESDGGAADALSSGDGANDGTTGTEASADGGADVSLSDSGGFCDGSMWVCDQFDDPPDSWPAPTWDDPASTTTAGASVAITGESSVSAPGAVAFATPVSKAAVNAQLRRGYVGPPFTGIQCTFQVRFTQPGQGAMELFVVSVGVVGNPDAYRAGLLAGPNSGYFYEDGVDTPVPGLPGNGWHHVVLDVKFGSGAQLTIDGALVVIPDAGSPSGNVITPIGVSLTLGLAYSSEVLSPWRALYDDVRCDVR